MCHTTSPYSCRMLPYLHRRSSCSVASEQTGQDHPCSHWNYIFIPISDKTTFELLWNKGRFLQSLQNLRFLSSRRWQITWTFSWRYYRHGQPLQQQRGLLLIVTAKAMNDPTFSFASGSLSSMMCTYTHRTLTICVKRTVAYSRRSGSFKAPQGCPAWDICWSCERVDAKYSEFTVCRTSQCAVEVQR